MRTLPTLAFNSEDSESIGSETQEILEIKSLITSTQVTPFQVAVLPFSSEPRGSCLAMFKNSTSSGSPSLLKLGLRFDNAECFLPFGYRK